MSFDTKKVVVIGDGSCGKTSLLMVYIKSEFPIEYIPTVFDTHLKEIQLNNNQQITLLLMDTSGQEDYARLRNLQYIQTNIFIICFSIDNRNSLNNIQTKWYPEIKSFKLPIILVGTKSDLRLDDNNNNYVTINEAEKIKKKIGAVNYLECSAKNQTGIEQVFRCAAENTIGIKNNNNKKKKKKTERCVLL